MFIKTKVAGRLNHTRLGDTLQPLSEYSAIEFSRLLVSHQDMKRSCLSTPTAIRLSAVSILVADGALVTGGIVSAVYGLGTEALPLTSSQGLEQLGRSAGAFALREALFLAYPIFVLPQGVALYVLLRHRAPYLFWPLVLWCVGLTLGIGIDVVTLEVARRLGVLYLAAGADARLLIESMASIISRTTLLGQFICDNLGGTLVYPFFATAAYRAGFISRGLGLLAVISSLSAFVAYRGMNLIFAEESALATACALGFYGLIWWDVSIALRLLRVQSVDLIGTPTISERPARACITEQAAG